MADYVSILDDTKHRANFFVKRRRKDIELYSILAECLHVCEQAQLDGKTEELVEALKRKPREGRNRVYIEKSSDIFLVVGRYVFEPELNRDACWRYTAVMREAHKRQINSRDLVKYLDENGGMNALFQNRSRDRMDGTVKTLFLNSGVTVSVGVPFNLRLVRKNDGSFDVLEAVQ